MNVTPPTISPRLRTREPVAAASGTPSAPASSNPSLRVLIRLPNVAAPTAATARFQFANKLFSTLKRRYAAAAFAVFVVCMVALLLRGKHGTAAHDDSGSDAPPWNGAVTVSPAAEGPVRPTFQSAAGQPLKSNAPSWPPAQQVPSDAQPAAHNVGAWQTPASGIGSASANSTAADDRMPSMPLRNPSYDARAGGAPTAPQSQSIAQGADYRTAQRYEPTANTLNRGPANPGQRDAVQFTGTIGSLPEQPNGDVNGSRNYR
jgi:hypothetical protein